MAAAPSIGRATGVEPHPTPDVDAAHALFERHSRRVLSYCHYQLGSREDAEDAMQSTFLYAFRGLRRGVVPQAEVAWLLKIAENVCLTRRRSAARRGRVEVSRDLEALQDVIPAPDAGDESVAALTDALAGMPENQRRAIVLREWHGLSYREIAAKLELSQSAVETLIFRARRSFVKQRQQLMHGLNAGPVVGAVKSALGGASAVKLAAAAVAVTTAAALAGGPVLDRLDASSSSPAPQNAAPDATETTTVVGAPLSLSHERPPLAARTPGRATDRQKTARTPGEKAVSERSASETSETPGTPVVSADDLPDPGSVLADPTSVLPDIPRDELPGAPSVPSDLPDLQDVPDLPVVPDVSDVVPTVPLP